MIYYDKAFFLFDYNKVIAKLDTVTTQWSSFGNLSSARVGANVAFDGEVFIVVGGSGTLKTEICTPTDSEITCESVSEPLLNYNYYPELFFVEDGFGKIENTN